MSASLVTTLEEVGDIDRLTTELFGRPLSAGGGVVHSAAVWQSPTDQWIVMRVNEASPKSPVDAFLLRLARARADAIVTTGKILREEPDLQHRLGSPGAEADYEPLLEEWRLERGLDRPPLLVVLTSGREIDPDHPAFHGWAKPLVFTGRDGAERLSHLERKGIQVVADPEPSLLRVVEYLTDEQRCATVTIEAGPSTASSLYDSPPLVDELVLSVYHGEALSEAACGDPFVPRQRIETVLTRVSGPYRVREKSGRWSFSRWTAGSGERSGL